MASGAPVDHRVTDVPAGSRTAPMGTDPPGDSLGGGDDVGHNPETVRAEAGAEAAECGNHLVEDQQDAMAFGDRPQPFEVAHRRHQDACRSGEGFDDDRRDGRGVVDRDDAFQLVGEVRRPMSAGRG